MRCCAATRVLRAGVLLFLTLAAVTGSGAVPTGRVLFMVDGTVVGDPGGEPPSSGSAARLTLRVATLNHGRHDVTATYLGDSNFNGSTAAVAQVVN